MNMIVATRDLSMEQVGDAQHCLRAGMDNDLTRVEVPPTSSLQFLGFVTVADLVELCPPYGRGHLGWPPCEGSWRWSFKSENLS